MLEILVAIYAVYTLSQLVLHALELDFVKKRMSGQAVILETEQFLTSANASLAKLKFKIFSLCYEFLVLIFWLFLGLGALRQLLETSFEAGMSTMFSQIIYFSLFLVIGAIISLPLDIYEKFVLDKKLGFSNMTAPLFISDFMKNIALVAVFGAFGAWLFMLCYNFLGSLWWVWAWALAFGIILLVNLIYPTIIAPIFNKMKPLENNELKESIESLLNACGFRSSGVFVMDASKRDNRLNAYFGGLGATKRVVLFDTLIGKLSKAEIIAVLAHELGHFKHKDIIKNIVFMGFMLFVFFGILGALNASVYGDLALGSGALALLVFFVLFSPVLGAIFMPVMSAFSRSHEFGADSFGAKNSNKTDMINALKKLGSENKAFPLSHPLYSAVYHSHPSLSERISALENL